MEEVVRNVGVGVSLYMYESGASWLCVSHRTKVSLYSILTEPPFTSRYVLYAYLLFSRHVKKDSWARIFKRLRSPGVDSKESIPPAYVAWRAGTSNIGLLYRPARLGIDSWAPKKGLQIRALLRWAEFDAVSAKKTTLFETHYTVYGCRKNSIKRSMVAGAQIGPIWPTVNNMILQLDQALT